MSRLVAQALMYHDVVDRSVSDGSGFAGPGPAVYKVGPARFDDHLEAISARVATPPATEIDVRNTGNAPTWILTFDDGGISAYDLVAERLEKRGWRGFFFVSTDYIGRAGFMSAEQIAMLARRGHVIGSHSKSHPKRMSGCTPDVLAQEWRDSVQALSGIIDAPVDVGSVPGGFYSKAVAEAASNAGIRVLFTSEPTRSGHVVGSCLVVGRFAIRRSTSSAEAAGLAAGDLVPRCRQWCSWNLKKVAKGLAGGGYARARTWLLGRGRDPS